MAVRRPLVYDDRPTGFNIYQLTNDEITSIINGTAEDAYLANPATTLTAVASGGNLAGLPMIDTRLFSTNWVGRSDRFATEAETPDTAVQQINYDRITQTIATPTIPADTNNLRWPVYLDGSGNIRAMTSTDFYDTFVVPALARITTVSSVGDYVISTSLSLPGHTFIGGPVFADTRANVAAYTAAGIGEIPLNFDVIINSYYLHRNVGNAYNDPGFMPLYIDAGTEQLYTYTQATWRATLGPWLQYYMSQTGSRESYSINGAGTTMGTVMLNTRLTPTSSGYTQRFVNDDDYRTQEFPNGTVFTENTYELKKTII